MKMDFENSKRKLALTMTRTIPLKIAAIDDEVNNDKLIFDKFVVIKIELFGLSACFQLV